jgi:ABC-2 type transport system permease protein
MSARRTLAITRRLLQGFRRDRRTLALLFVAPLVLLGLIGYLLRGPGTGAPLGVVNEDCGALGAQITRTLLQSELVDAAVMRRDQADAQVRDGSLAGSLRFSCDFSAQAARGIVAPVLRLEGSQPSQSTSVLQATQQALARAVAPRNLRVAPQVSYAHGGEQYDALDYFGPAFVGLVVFFLVFVVTSVSFLRERSQGTLERLMATPVRRGEIVLGYMLGFSAVALVQGVVVLLFSLYALRVHSQGSVALVFLVEALLAVAAVNLGIFLSMFARTEFQAVQFIPLVIVPQFLLSGIVFAVASEPRALQDVSNVLPLTYAVYGLRDVMVRGEGLGINGLLLDVAVVAAFCAVLVVAATMTLRRRVA